jgi:hypothetical protein
MKIANDAELPGAQFVEKESRKFCAKLGSQEAKRTSSLSLVIVFLLMAVVNIEYALRVNYDSLNTGSHDRGDSLNKYWNYECL